MIDSHAHIDGTAFADDISAVLSRAFESGIERIIIPAIEPKAFDGLFQLTESDNRLHCSIGVHPHHAVEVNDEILKRVEELSFNKKVVAIGEIGIDYFYDFAPKEVQKTAFRQQIHIAKRRKLPLIVHNREADDDIISILEDEQDGSLEGVLHCFSSSSGIMEKAVGIGFYVSFTGNITFKKSDLSETVRATPIERILLETDSPYMTPVPMRGKRNEPAYVKLVAEKIAEIKSLSIDEVIKMTTENAKRLFKFLAFSLLFMFSIVFTYAQSGSEETKDEPDSLIHPFDKFIGINPTVGMNTIVQTYTWKPPITKQQDISYEGILFYGGGLTFGIFDYMLAKVDYLYSLNQKKADNTPEADPLNRIGVNVHQFFELRTIWLINPYSRVNFFGSIGAAYIDNVYDKGAVDIQSGKDYSQKNSSWALNAGVGFIVNISLKNYGLINIMAEWNLNFDMKETSVDKIVGYKKDNSTPPKIIEVITEPTGVSSFYSMPRLSIIYYPPFKTMFSKSK